MKEALIALLGVLVGGSLQLLITRSLIKAENERLRQQIAAYWSHDNYLAWQRRFHDAISDLIAATDPELHLTISKDQVIPLIHRARLCLNPQVPAHAKCNSALGEFSLSTTSWQGRQDLSTMLSLHNALIESARATLWLPGR